MGETDKPGQTSMGDKYIHEKLGDLRQKKYCNGACSTGQAVRATDSVVGGIFARVCAGADVEARGVAIAEKRQKGSGE